MPRAQTEEKMSEKKKVVIVAMVTESYDSSKGFSAFVSELRKKYSDTLETTQISLMIV
jgi:hypothetical protein